MVGCEACHGPGALHVDAANRFVLSTTDSAKIEQEMRDTIVKTPTDDVCVQCHRTQAHEGHPAYEGQHSSQAAVGAVVQCDPALAVALRSTATTVTALDQSLRYSVKSCGSCHYDEYKQWRTQKHSALSAMLPSLLRNDQNCQTCHPGEDAASIAANSARNADPNWVGATCESCHGPALEHVHFNVPFIHGPPLDPQLEQAARQSIRQGKPATTCVQCHVRQRHMQHPQFDEN
jgi:nitrate/TMAO reductase-like tetraheme cytochrome c subunit